VTALPSDCVMVSGHCASNSEGDIHAYTPGSAMGVVYVSTGDGPLYNIAADPFPATPATPTSAEPRKSIVGVVPMPLTLYQFDQLGLSAGMRQIYAEGAQAGLLTSGISSTATPIPSYTP
jgi:hypothetical protein